MHELIRGQSEQHPEHSRIVVSSSCITSATISASSFDRPRRCNLSLSVIYSPWWTAEVPGIGVDYHLHKCFIRCPQNGNYTLQVIALILCPPLTLQKPKPIKVLVVLRYFFEGRRFCFALTLFSLHLLSSRQRRSIASRTKSVHLGRAAPFCL